MESFSPTKMNYAKCIQLQKNIDVKENNKPMFPVQNALARTFNFALLVPQFTCSNSIEALNIT